MIELKPNPSLGYCCPRCGSDAGINVLEPVISGMHTYADCKCVACKFEFYQMLPVSHCVNIALAVDKHTHALYNGSPEYGWLSRIVKDGFPLSAKRVSIKKYVYAECEEVVILNALDFLYGHSLLKLYNAQHHLDHDKNIGLIVIIPKLLEWMVPQGCAEVWVVDLPLAALTKGYTVIAEFVSTQMKRFSRIYLSKAYSHPEFTSVDISRFTGVDAFQLKNFSNTTPRITFVLREDRWWFATSADYWFYRITRALKLRSLGKRVLSNRQNRLVKKTILKIRRELPHAQFHIAGLGNIGSYDGYANDDRSVIVDENIEKTWCRVYGKSHVVVGFHGSNMLLPTAFAAGCVEILPEDRYGNMVQDLSVRYTDRKQLFFYRFVDQYARPASVASKALSIIRHYKAYHENMCMNIYPDKPMTRIKESDDAYHRSIITSR